MTACPDDARSIGKYRQQCPDSSDSINEQTATTMLLFRCPIILFCAVVIPSVAALAESNDKLPLRFSRIELTDGRAFDDVVVRSYDAKSGKLLIVTSGKAMTIPVALFPAPFNERLKAAPASGGSVSVTHSVPRPQPDATENADRPDSDVAAPATPPPPVEVAPRRERPERPPARKPAREELHPAEANPIRHQFAARARATRHYRYEYQIGSNLISVTSLDIELSAPQPVPGWTGRCSTEGKAYLEFFDSKGRSYQRATSTFEVVTEQKPGEELKVVDFTRKS
jgi:hypothetical protein